MKLKTTIYNTMTIKIKKKMQSFQISEAQISGLSILQARLNESNEFNPISKNALVAEALDLLFKKYKI